MDAGGQKAEGGGFYLKGIVIILNSLIKFHLQKSQI